MDLNNKKATRQSYGEALVELGKVNDKVVVLDADLAGATKTNMFSKEFPDRFFDMGIAEQDMMYLQQVEYMIKLEIVFVIQILMLKLEQHMLVLP